MRFVEGGPNIPDELIEQVMASTVVFLCGAGVSMRVGLPSFKELTEKIYENIGETYEGDFAENDAFVKGEFDRTLRALEKRLLRNGERSRVRDACVAVLQPPSGPFTDHEALLALSRDRQGRVRLLTTNFDTLFERAASDAGIDVSSHAVKALPKPASMTDHGVLHLHGRIADVDYGLTQSDLVLTSADFGDAYLRDGWASQYMEDRIRSSILVLVGYRAEDAALRLLLETLDVDRERFPDLCKIYALDNATPESRAIWSTKGILAIDAPDRDMLYASIREWANYARAPHDFAKARLQDILAKDPIDTSDFEREQLSFLVTRDNGPAILIATNPSLAWLRTLADLKIVNRDQGWLGSWLERNLDNPDAVRDVVANISLLGPKVGDFLDYRLRHLRAAPVEPYATAWNLIIRHLRSQEQRPFGGGWFAIKPRFAGGDVTPDVLEQLAELLRPRLRVSKRYSPPEAMEEVAIKVHDLMAVDLETDENIDVAEILHSWNPDVPAEHDARLLKRLSEALEQALDDAVALGIEAEGAYSATDSDVPSVADHPQNAYRHGFLPIVRVIAEIWTRLANKDANEARRFVKRWGVSGHKLERRIALFAAENAVIAPNSVTELIALIPSDEFFFSNSTVEVYRLLRSRWADIQDEARRRIEKRFVVGPSPTVFRDGVDIPALLDRERYEAIGALMNLSPPIDAETRLLFEDIQGRHPGWRLRPNEQTGFHMWMGGISGEESGSVIPDFEGVSDEDLVAAAQRQDETSHFGDASSWSALCRDEPERALRGLKAAALRGDRSSKAWRALIGLRNNSTNNPIFSLSLACALIEFPDYSFKEIVYPVAEWLISPAGLRLDQEFWVLWDKIFCNLGEEKDTEFGVSRYFDQSINTAVGDLAAGLIKKMPAGEQDAAFAQMLEPRLDALCGLPRHNGVLARVRLSADISFLHARAPIWTAKNLAPSFAWADPLALAMWSARIYSTTIGSPALFALLKGPFLEMFERSDVPIELKERYAEWLLVPLFSNRAYDAGYDLSFLEARKTLRRIGPEALRQIGHRFVVEMERVAADEKLTAWREVIGPVFKGTWPLDAELQTSQANYKLVHILRVSGEAFPEVAEDVIPLIAKVSGEDYLLTLSSLSGAADELYDLAPRKFLELVKAIVGDAELGSVRGLNGVLDRLERLNPEIADMALFQRLRRLAVTDE